MDLRCITKINSLLLHMEDTYGRTEGELRKEKSRRNE